MFQILFLKTSVSTSVVDARTNVLMNIMLFFFRARVNEHGNVVGLNEIVCVFLQADLDVKMKRSTATHVIFHLAMYATKYHYFNGRTSLKHSLQSRKCKHIRKTFKSDINEKT